MGVLTDKINSANTLGRTNLAEKGVEISESATTYEIMNAIAEVSGGGIEYTSIYYNEDDTITLTDTDGTTHTIVCTYEGDRLVGVTYDGDAVELTYEGEKLVGIDGTSNRFDDIQLPRTDMVVSSAGGVMFHSSGNGEDITKIYDGDAICGYCQHTASKYEYYTFFCVGTSASAVELANASSGHTYTTGTFEYNGITYYYSTVKIFKMWTSNINGAFWYTGNSDATPSVQIPLIIERFENNRRIIDLQNGFAMGLASNGVVKAEPFDCLQYANTYANLFNGSAFPDGTEISFNVLNATDFSSMFKFATGLTKATIKGNNNENALRLNGIFNSNGGIKTVDFSKCKLKGDNCATAFYGTSALTQIIGEFDFSSATNVTNMFVQATSLEEVRFKETTLSLSISFAQSSKLSADSIDSIVKGLAKVETTQTLTLNSAIVLTDEQKATINTKGWTLVQ